MKLGILVVFSYNRQLPGAVQDIYHAAQYMSKICDTIAIFSDVDQDEDIKIISRNINEGYMKSDALKFIQSLQTARTLYNVRDGLCLLDSIDDTLQKEKWGGVFFYYSGHSRNGKIDSPERQSISFDSFLSLMMRKTSPGTPIFSVLDCCFGEGMNLPYTMDGRGIYRLIRNRPHVQHPVICISSSAQDGRSVSSQIGSIFTHEFFREIRQNKLDLYEIRGHLSALCSTSDSPQVFVYSSSPSLTHLWPWLVGRKLEIFTHPFIRIRHRIPEKVPKKSDPENVVFASETERMGGTLSSSLEEYPELELGIRFTDIQFADLIQ